METKGIQKNDRKPTKEQLEELKEIMTIFRLVLCSPGIVILPLMPLAHSLPVGVYFWQVCG